MKHLKIVEQIPSVDVLKAMEKPYVLYAPTIGGGGELQYNYVEPPKDPKLTRWYNGDTLIKELDVVGGLTASYKEASATRCEIGTDVTSISDWAFLSCTSLSSMEIPNSVTSIGDYAFYDCSSLTSIEIPNSVTRIGAGAFRSCESLTSVEIPNSVTRIGADAFRSCSSLTSLIYAEGCTTVLRTYANFITNVTIPNSVTSIDSAFNGCDRLNDIYYGGTISQWNSITKGSNWNNGVPTSCIVHCIDGDIAI